MTSTQVKQGWQRVKISDIAYVNSNSLGKNFDFNNIEYVDISSVGTGVLEETKTMRIEEAPSRAKRLVKKGSTILATVRPNRRSFYYISKPLENMVVSTGFAVLDAKQETDSRFLYYLISNQSFTDYLVGHAKGAAYPAVDSETIKNALVSVPEFSTQQKIASILSAFDDLIENNTKRIKILENTAQLIYKEWFVDFKFPGHEKVKMVDSGTEFGEIPEGWEVKEIGEIIETQGGGTPSTKIEEYWENGEINWFSPVDLTRNGMLFITNSGNKINELGLQKSSAKMFPAYSVMMTSRATIGVVAINTTPACTNQGFITCIPNKTLSAYQIYFWLQQNMSLINNLASGATFKEITKTNFRKIPITISDNEISEEFTRLVKPLFDEIENLQAQIFRLRETRDLLLPKLVKGEVTVDNLMISK